jgi:hypothetical protein
MQVKLKSDNNNRYFTCWPVYMYEKSHWILFRMRNFSDKGCRENQNTCYVQYNFSKSHAIYDNVDRYGRARQGTVGNVIWWGKNADTHW